MDFCVRVIYSTKKRLVLFVSVCVLSCASYVFPSFLFTFLLTFLSAFAYTFFNFYMMSVFFAVLSFVFLFFWLIWTPQSLPSVVMMFSLKPAHYRFLNLEKDVLLRPWTLQKPAKTLFFLKLKENRITLLALVFQVTNNIF